MRFVFAVFVFAFPIALRAQEAPIFEAGAKVKVVAEGEGVSRETVDGHRRIRSREPGFL